MSGSQSVLQQELQAPHAGNQKLEQFTQHHQEKEDSGHNTVHKLQENKQGRNIHSCRPKKQHPWIKKMTSTTTTTVRTASNERRRISSTTTYNNSSSSSNKKARNKTIWGFDYHPHPAIAVIYATDLGGMYHHSFTIVRNHHHQYQ